MVYDVGLKPTGYVFVQPATVEGTGVMQGYRNCAPVQVPFIPQGLTHETFSMDGVLCLRQTSRTNMSTPSI